MRASLSNEGWKESPLLPPLWRFRKCKTGRNEYSFLTAAEEGDGQVVSRKDKILIRHAVTHFLFQLAAI